jgi:lipopolysaccharide transport system permease protein
MLALVDVQARMALRGDASRLWLGYLWWILEPLLYVAVFYLVFEVILGSGRADFLFFLICGKLPFMWFSGGVNTSANAIVLARGLIGQTRLPKLMFPLAKVQESLYRQAAVFALLLGFALAAGSTPGWHWLWLLALALVQYLLIVACAVAGSVAVCGARDFVRVIQLGTVFMLFVSGIFWDVRAIPDPQLQQLILVANPLAFLLDGYRQVLMYGAAPDGMHLFILGAASLAACGAMFALVGRLEYWLARQVLSQ